MPPPISLGQGNNTTAIAGPWWRKKGPQLPGQAPSLHCAVRFPIWICKPLFVQVNFPIRKVLMVYNFQG